MQIYSFLYYMLKIMSKPYHFFSPPLMRFACHVVLLHQNNTIMNAHKTPILKKLTLYITKALQLKHNIVIAMSSNQPTIGETKYYPLFSPKLSLIPQKHS